MTETTIELDPVQAEARANAEWIDGKMKEQHTWELQFLRYRPARELTDVLGQATEIGASDDTIVCLTEAIALSRGHTGGPSPAPLGYTALYYAPSDTETEDVLEQAVELTRRIQLPGGQYGWRWTKDTKVDPAARTVTIVLTADHPRLP